MTLPGETGDKGPAQDPFYWIVAILALIWFAMGCANFLYQMNPGAIESYPPAEQAMIRDRPTWATAGFALSVFAGLAGAVAMLLRRSFSEHLMLVSLLGTMAATAYPILQGISTGFFLMFMTTVLPLAFGILFFWIANSAKDKPWMR